MIVGDEGQWSAKTALARSERFELPTLGIEIRCSIQLSYERAVRAKSPASPGYQTWMGKASLRRA